MVVIGANIFLKPFKTNDGKVIYKLINGNRYITTIMFGKPIDEYLAKSPVINFISQFDGLIIFNIPVNDLGNVFMYKEGNKWILDFDNHIVNDKSCNLLFNIGHFEAEDTLEETNELTFNYVPLDEEYAVTDADIIKVYKYDETFTINLIRGDKRWAIQKTLNGVDTGYLGIYNNSNVSLIDKNESKTGYLVTDPMLYSIVL